LLKKPLLIAAEALKLQAEAAAEAEFKKPPMCKSQNGNYE
jgi:hypothetical protein